MAEMIVIGADTHKASHTFVAVQAETGRIVSTRTVRADAEGLLDAWQWAHALAGRERVWAVEDCRHVSGRLERMLVGQGERVVRVAPKLTGELRRGERRPGKSDEIDAVAAARAAIREGVENLPVAFLDEQALEIRLLNDYRAQLIGERTRHQNRLRWHLVDLDPELEQQVPDRALARDRWVERINRRLASLPQTVRVRIARDELKRIRELTRSERALERELIGLIEALRPDLLAEPGIGPITAATLIGRTAGAARFPTDGHYARQAGAAPIPASSGNTVRVRLNRGGDRQLNAALHRIAFTRARTCPGRRQNPRRGLPLPQTIYRPPRLAPPQPNPQPHPTTRHHHPLQHPNQRTRLDIGATLASHLAAKGDSLAHSAIGPPLGREESSNGGSLAVLAFAALDAPRASRNRAGLPYLPAFDGQGPSRSALRPGTVGKPVRSPQHAAWPR
jgi:transposase